MDVETLKNLARNGCAAAAIIAKDGDQYYVLIGTNIQEGLVGYGVTIPDALRDLANTIDGETKVQSFEANSRQIGGSHYKKRIEHWDWSAACGLDYFQGCITKYVARWKEKDGLKDLLKAEHFLQKYLELVRSGTFAPAAKEPKTDPVEDGRL